MDSEILDDVKPRNIRNIEYATFGERLLAVILDILFTMVPIGGLVLYAYFSKNIMVLLASTLVGMLYKPIMEGVWGATLGKMVLKIKMVDSNLEQMDLGQSILKNGFYIISSIIAILGNIWLGNSEAFLEAENIMEVSQAASKTPYTVISYIWTAVIVISCFAMLASDLKQTLHDKIANVFCIKTSVFDE